jgi:endogenous inhibitor of DNA gyrase (YacG/DUF329 family)
MIDLGAWASEEYRVAVKVKDDAAELQPVQPNRDSP